MNPTLTTHSIFVGRRNAVALLAAAIMGAGLMTGGLAVTGAFDTSSPAPAVTSMHQSAGSAIPAPNPRPDAASTARWFHTPR